MKPNTPIAFFIFNRPVPTQRVFTEIARQRPATLLIIADGPRHQADVAGCAATRQIVANIDWPCEVRRNYSDSNLGCRRRMYTGINWVFSQFEQAILLEDDCLPHPTFFPFCTELLERYRDDDRVMMISGDNMHPGRRWTGDSYYFSVMTHIWGWATWRRAWQHHNAQMPDWPALEQSNFPGSFVPSSVAARFYRKMMADTFTGKLNAWSLAWMFVAWKRRMVTILPSVNLISNIGFGPDATHTRKIDPFADLPIEPMDFPLVHPQNVAALADADMAFFKAAIKAA